MYLKCPAFFHWNHLLPRFNLVASFNIFFNSRTPFFSFGFYHKQQATLRILGHLEDDFVRCVDNPVYRIQDGKCHWEAYAGVFVYSVCSPWCYERCFIRIPKVGKFVLSRHFTSLWFIIILWITKHHQNAKYEWNQCMKLHKERYAVYNSLKSAMPAAGKGHDYLNFTNFERRRI